MLISFSVANYRSFAAEQCLSLSAGRFRSERVGAVLDTPVKDVPHLLRAACLLGANGAGKSNVISALDFLQDLVANSAQSMQKGDTIEVTPFKLDADLVEEPSTFEILFFYEGVEYHYNISVSKKEVISECLLARSKSKPLREVFSRVKTVDGIEWNLGSLPKAQAKLWRQSTRDNALFLSTAVQLNSEELAKPFEWITDRLRVQTTQDGFSASLTAHLLKDHVEDGCRDAILNLIKEADLAISDVIVDEMEFDESNIPEDISDEVRKAIMARMKDQKFYSSRFVHRTRQKEPTVFELEDESEGTQRLFEMAGPWISSLRHDVTLVVDELDRSLHPLLARLLVRMFQDPEDKASKAQLIFSTHDLSFLDAGVLERDQVWFVEKRRAGNSELIPLLEYRPRKGEAVRQNYLRGRYGGIPAITGIER